MRVYLIIRAKVVPLRRFLWAYPSKHAFLTIKIIHIMRKLFLLIPVMLISLIANAKVTNINNSTADALRLALYNSTAGDTIVMAEGIYEESNSDYIAWRRSNVVMAAEGANVIIKPHVSFRVRGGARAELIGVKIDASELNTLSTSYKNIFESGENVDGNCLILENCEIYGNPTETVIRAQSDKKLDSIIINNCYIHDNAQVILRLESTSMKGVIITNSTIANIANGGSFWVAPMDIKNTSSDAKVIVDHCTFYHNTSISSSYADVTVGYSGSATSDVTITNCIFAQPAPYEGSRAINLVNGGTVRNCLTFNYTKSTNGIQGATVKENCIAVDPLFTDAANGVYSFPGNWVTPSISPARGAATDGSDLGDPRWYSAEVLPDVDFASPYQFIGPKALLTGQIGLNTNDHIEYYDTEAKGTATWKIHATRACVLNATLNMEAGSSSGHKFKVEALDADGNSVGELAEPSSTSSDGNINLPGTLSIPAEGDYTVILYNLTAWSSAKLEGVTFTYVGGDVQAMPGTTNIADAWFSAQGTRADGKIDFPDGYIQDGWVKWNVSFADAANYNVTVNIENANGHWYTVALYRSESDESPITVTEGAQKSTIGTLELGAMEVPAGNYILKVTNATQYSDAKLISVNFAYAGGAAIDLSKTTPASLLPNADAILSDDWSIEEGKISYAESKATTGYAKWNVNCADYANYNVTVNISSDNGHGIRVEVFEDEVQPAIYTLDEPSSGKYHTGDLALDLGNILLADREYVVKITNTVSSSHAKIASIVITYVNGAQATLPATFNFEDGMLSAKAHVTAGELWFNEIGDSNPVGQWAKWNVKAAAAGTFLFTMNVSSTNSQSYKISILDELENEIDAFESGSLGSGDKTVKHYFNLAAGNYTVQLENTYSWSQGHIVSLVVTQPSLLVLDEAAETNAVIHDNYRNGMHDIQIIRTIVAGMYNTICLPFDVSSSQLPAIFGSNVELKQMSSAELNGDELDLIFADATSIYRGTPYLIKTSSNIVNPVFTDVEIKEEAGQVTTGTNADFIGSFIKGEVPAGENNLFLGPNNLLYFSQTATPIKGMRAWFQVKGVPNAMQAIKRANIVTSGQVITSVDFVKDANNGTLKTIENGQVFIIRDGIRYNVMGIKLQ